MKEVTRMVINSRKVGSQVILEKQTIVHVPVALYCTGPRRHMRYACDKMLASAGIHAHSTVLHT